MCRVRGCSNPRCHTGDERLHTLQARSIGVPDSVRQQAAQRGVAHAGAAGYTQLLPLMLHNDPSFLAAATEAIQRHNASGA